MLKLIIEDDEGRRTVVPFVRDEITIGRQEGNTIRLTERNVSRRHARLLRQTDTVFLEDLGSYNGIRVNGEKVVGRTSISDGDLVQIGDYDLAIQAEGTDQPAPAPVPPAEAAQTLPAYPRSLGGNGRPEEPETESSSPVYEDAEPVADEEHTPAVASTQPAPKSPELARRQSTSVIRVDKVESNRSRPLVALDPEEAPRLVVLNTEFAGREFACIRTELRIGRTDDNDICIDHRSLSRTHAKLVREVEGEWRIIDMQSANGLAVNGDSYAQATLNHLDVLELGHVKLKFVGAGESYTFVPGTETLTSKKSGSSKAPLFIGLAVGALALGTGAFFLLGRTPAPVTPPAKGEAVPATAANPPAEAGGNAAATRLDAARSAIARHAFEDAVKELEALKKLEGVEAALLADAEDLLDQARAELLLKARLDEAATALDRGQLAQARKLLDDASTTSAWTNRHKALTATLSAAEEEQEKKKAVAVRGSRTEPQSPRQPNVESPKPVPAEEARKVFEDGLALFNKKQHREARTVFSRCLDVDPSFAKCHLMLGSTYARLGEMESGARHYRMFVKLAPNAPETAKVRDILEKFETQGNNSN